MASSLPSHEDERSQTHFAKSHYLELAYQESLRFAEKIMEDEESRRFQLQIQLLEDDNNDLQEQLSMEDRRIDELEAECGALQGDLELSESSLRQFQIDLRARDRELNKLRAELQSMNGLSTDSTELLTEKLALARELAKLRPELEHLRAQTSNHQSVLAEKLSLQRQVCTLEVELENEKRASNRVTKKGPSSDQLDELYAQIDTLRNEHEIERRTYKRAAKDAADKADELHTQIDALQNELQNSKRALERAAKKNTSTNEVDELHEELDTLRTELENEKRASKRAAKKDTSSAKVEQLQAVVDGLRNELENEKLASKRAPKKEASSHKVDELQVQINVLRNELSAERQERERMVKDAERVVKEREGRQEVLESKLDQMRTKLRSTKSDLKDAQTEVEKLQAEATKASITSTNAETNAPKGRKRAAGQISTDAMIGTPDGVAVRGRPGRKAAVKNSFAGEKSMFSITPFLNRTTSVAPDTPKAVDEVGESPNVKKIIDFKPAQRSIDDTKDDSAKENLSEPTKVLKVQKKAAEKKVLKDISQKTMNAKAGPKKRPTLSNLEDVAEEEDDDCAEVSSKALVKAVVSENAEPKKKRRKLFGSSKTLFDEDDGDAPKRSAKISLAPARTLGKVALGPKLGPQAVGFGAFSPLKKDRRGTGASFLA